MTCAFLSPSPTPGRRFISLPHTHTSSLSHPLPPCSADMWLWQLSSSGWFLSLNLLSVPVRAHVITRQRHEKAPYHASVARHCVWSIIPAACLACLYLCICLDSPVHSLLSCLDMIYETIGTLWDTVDRHVFPEHFSPPFACVKRGMFSRIT